MANLVNVIGKLSQDMMEFPTAINIFKRKDQYMRSFIIMVLINQNQNQKKIELYVPYALKVAKLQFTNTDGFRDLKELLLLTRKKDNSVIVDGYVLSKDIRGIFGFNEYRIYYLLRPIWKWHTRWADDNRANIIHEQKTKSMGTEVDLSMLRQAADFADETKSERQSVIVIPYKDYKEDTIYKFRFVILYDVIKYVETKGAIYEYEKTVHEDGMETVIKRTLVGIPMHITQTDDPFC